MALHDAGIQRAPELRLGQKIWQLSWGLIVLIALVASFGFAMLYSAANGSMEPWAYRQVVRFGAGLVLLVVVALIDIRFWFRYAYVIYLGALGLLVAVEIMGSIGMGAQRWINLGVIQLQPSEIMKVALVLGLARYFHGVAQEDIPRPSFLELHAIDPACAEQLGDPKALGLAFFVLILSASMYFNLILANRDGDRHRIALSRNAVVIEITDSLINARFPTPYMATHRCFACVQDGSTAGFDARCTVVV